MIRALIALLAVAAAAAVDCPGTWQDRAAPPLQSMSFHNNFAVTLPDGRVLAVGRSGNGWASAVYDPSSDAWTVPVPLPLLPMPDLKYTEASDDPQPPNALPVSPESLTLMPDGTVVAIAHGGRFWTQRPDEFAPQARVIMAALHWSTGGWSIGGTIGDSRVSFAAARLGSDRIVAVGGHDFRQNAPGGQAIIYDVPARTWSVSGDAWLSAGGDPLPRPGMTATRLVDGRVVAAGGAEYLGTTPYADTYIIGLDGSWTPSGPMLEGRVSHIAALLPDGRVLAAGGTGYGPLGPEVTGTTDITSAEIYAPSTGTWTAAQAAPGSVRLGVTLSDGRVLALASDGGAYVFQSSVGTWCTTTPPPAGILAMSAMADGAVVAISATNTYRFTFDEEPTPPGAGTLDITEVRWVISVEADTVRVGGALAAEAAGERWEATTALPGAADNDITIEWTAGSVTRTATASANEVTVPLGGG